MLAPSMLDTTGGKLIAGRRGKEKGRLPRKRSTWVLRKNAIFFREGGRDGPLSGRREKKGKGKGCLLSFLGNDLPLPQEKRGAQGKKRGKKKQTHPDEAFPPEERGKKKFWALGSGEGPVLEGRGGGRYFYINILSRGMALCSWEKKGRERRWQKEKKKKKKTKKKKKKKKREKEKKKHRKRNFYLKGKIISKKLIVLFIRSPSGRVLYFHCEKGKKKIDYSTGVGKGGLVILSPFFFKDDHGILLLLGKGKEEKVWARFRGKIRSIPMGKMKPPV